MDQPSSRCPKQRLCLLKDRQYRSQRPKPRQHRSDPVFLRARNKNLGQNFSALDPFNDTFLDKSLLLQTYGNPCKSVDPAVYLSIGTLKTAFFTWRVIPLLVPGICASCGRRTIYCPSFNKYCFPAAIPRSASEASS